MTRQPWRRRPFKTTDAQAMLRRVLASDGWTVGEAPTGWWVRMEGEPVDGPHRDEAAAEAAMFALAASRDRP